MFLHIRDLSAPVVRQRYWIGRFQRFYPDFLLSSLLATALKVSPFIGCHVISAVSWIFNFSSLFLLSAWLTFVPGVGYLNGPAWFIVALAWLWIAYPLVQRPLAALCRSDSFLAFALKFLALWAASALPAAILLWWEYYGGGSDGNFGSLVSPCAACIAC